LPQVAWPERQGGFTEALRMLGRISIGREHGNQKQDERDRGNKAGRLPQQPQAASDFAESRNRDEGSGGGNPRLPQNGWDHGPHRAGGGGHKVANAHRDKRECEGDTQGPLGYLNSIHDGSIVAPSCHMATAASRRH